MGMFLKAAYEVLRMTKKPLTAPELVGAASALGLLKTSGKTPAQTMKSKLATHILMNGDRSPFMRAAKGQFALREWKSAYPEHIADRYQKALFDEDIVVFPASSLRRYVPFDGLYNGSFDKGDLYDECRPMRRREAEEDFSVIQLVSVFVIRHNNRYLTYMRTKRLPESRLHGVYSIGFGGHLNPSDLSNIFEPALGLPVLERELREEVKFESLGSTDICYRGLIYDTSREISKQHLGLVYDVVASSPAFEIGERGFLMNPKYETLEEIDRRRNDFENWSLLLIDEEIRCKQTQLIQTYTI